MPAPSDRIRHLATTSHAHAQVAFVGGKAPGSRQARRVGRPGQGIIEANRKVRQDNQNARIQGGVRPIRIVRTR